MGAQTSNLAPTRHPNYTAQHSIAVDNHSVKMKSVNEMVKTFNPRCAARLNDDCTHHLLGPFANGCLPKRRFQTYFLIKIIIFDEPERCL